MKTPDQVAALYAEQFRFDTDPRGGEVHPEVHKAIREAIEADRAQRDMAMQALIDAWTIPGANPKYHKQMQAVVRGSWPMLHQAVKAIVKGRRH